MCIVRNTREILPHYRYFLNFALYELFAYFVKYVSLNQLLLLINDPNMESELIIIFMNIIFLCLNHRSKIIIEACSKLFCRNKLFQFLNKLRKNIISWIFFFSFKLKQQTFGPKVKSWTDDNLRSQFSINFHWFPFIHRAQSPPHSPFTFLKIFKKYNKIFIHRKFIPSRNTADIISLRV